MMTDTTESKQGVVEDMDEEMMVRNDMCVCVCVERERGARVDDAEDDYRFRLFLLCEFSSDAYSITQ